MNTRLAFLGKQIDMAPRARRRWFVALVYAVLAVFDLAEFFASAKKSATSIWIIGVCGVLSVVVVLVLWWLAGATDVRCDEREMHRRDHAHFRAYRVFMRVIFVGALGYSGIVDPLLKAYFKGPNPITLSPLALREYLRILRHFELTAVLLYFTLPQAILLWTEPDNDSGQERVS